MGKCQDVGHGCRPPLGEPICAFGRRPPAQNPSALRLVHIDSNPRSCAACASCTLGAPPGYRPQGKPETRARGLSGTNVGRTKNGSESLTAIRADAFPYRDVRIVL